MTARAPRGECGTCGTSCRLRKDGTIGGHWALLPPGDGTGMDEVRRCPGTGQPPAPLRFYGSFPVCVECSDFAMKAGAMLSEAVHSTAIETGGDPWQMYKNFIGTYHRNRHQLPEGS